MAAGDVIATGPHGGDGLALARSLGIEPSAVIDLSASLNPAPPTIDDVIARSAWLARHYPDPEPAHHVLAAALGVDVEQLVVTNGGAEAIALLAAVLRRGTVVEPEFSLYRRHLDHVDDTAGDDPAADASRRWRSNPCNPLGTLAGADEAALVWDEAYWPMTMGTWSRGDDASWRLGSLTKLWACPGIRLGYLVAPDRAGADAVRALQPRWSVNAVALHVLPELLDREDLRRTASTIASARRRFAADVASLGYAVRDGVAPWLLVDHSSGLRSALAPAGIVVRDCASYGMPGVHRIALPPDAVYDRVLDALTRALAGRSE